MLDTLAPGTQVRGSADTYTILNLVGRVGMGVVYRVTRASDSSIWALKEMRPQGELAPEDLTDTRQLFEREALLLKSLSHPSLPVVAELFANDGRPTLVMEFVPGQTLEDRIRDANAPLLKKDAVGANASTLIKRSEFNAGKHVPNVGDEVTITVAIEAIKG